MATHRSAIKRHKQSLKRRDRNRSQRSAIRTSVKETLKLLETGDREAALAQAKAATRLFDKAVVHGLLHKNNAARSISRLHKRILVSQA